MSKCSDMTLALACWNNAGVPTQVFVHNEYRTAANGARTLHATRFTDANGVPVTVNAADVKPGACSGAAATVENIVSPYNALGDLVGVPVREVREFDASGTLVSTTYYDTVTNAPVTLPATAVAVTTSLAFTPVVIEMCEAGVTFLRKFVYHPSGTLFNVYDTTADGQTGFVATAAATIGRCATTFPPDVEFETLCDNNGGVVTEFTRRIITTFSATGSSASVAEDFNLDLTAVYTPTGIVGKCNQDCDVAAPVGVVATWG